MIKILDRRIVKIIAIVTMLIDHIAYGASWLTIQPVEIFGFSVSTNIHLMRSIGRMAFPLFCFQFIHSLSKTKDDRMFAAKLVLLAIVSQIPYELLTITNKYSANLNIIWLFAIFAMFEVFREDINDMYRPKNKINKYMLNIIIMAVFVVCIYTLKVDYRSFGALFLVSLKVIHKYNPKFTPLIALIMLNIFYYPNQDYQIYASVSAIIMWLYNDKKLTFNYYEQLFYNYFYPVHQLIIWWLLCQN